MKKSDSLRASGGGALSAGRRTVSQVVSINVIAHLLRNLEFVIKRSRNKCAMTFLNIQSPAFWGDVVIIWQVFIRILRYNGSKAVGRIVKFSLSPALPQGRGSRKTRFTPHYSHFTKKTSCIHFG